ncbi:MAG TPA: hypothetical protein IAC45_02845 [Candidatus Aphodousia faecavium]|nr:hypothetical protein [Candidatus Aphodousia faecavium]
MQAVMQIDDKLQLLIDIEDVSALTRPVDAGVRVNLWRYDEIKSWVCNLSNRESCISTAQAVRNRYV